MMEQYVPFVEELSTAFEKKGIWVFDRGNDHKAFFTWLRHEQHLRFVPRVKEIRMVIVKETGLYCKVTELPVGKHNYRFYSFGDAMLIL